MIKHFQTEIEHLKKKVLSLSVIVEESVFKALKGVLRHDAQIAQSVIDGDGEVDSMEVEVEEDCLKILALYQPVATDLRFIVAVLKLNNDLERIGDLAVNIAQRAVSLAKLKRIETGLDFAGMADKVKLMLRNSLDSLVNLDPELAKKVMAADDEVDSKNAEMHRTIQAAMHKDPGSLENYVLLISVSRNLERIADHATNIAEDVIYMVQGEIVRHGKH